MVRGRDRGEQQAAGVSARLEQLGTVLNDLIMKLWSGRPEEEAVRIAGEQLRNVWQAAKDMGFYVGKSPWDFIPKTY